MNFHVYLEPELAARLSKLCRGIPGKARNALVRDALRVLLDTQEKQSWPASIVTFRPLNGVPRFESGRKNLAAPNEEIW